MNVVDTQEVREFLGTKNTDELLAAMTAAAIDLIMTSESSAARIIYNTTYSTVSTTIVWLQERGVKIPADILATLKIEG